MGTSVSTRDRILDEALSLFASRGVKATTVDDIATAAGLAPRSGAIYRHFPSKQAILDAAIDAHLSRLESAKTDMRAMLPLGDQRADLTLTARWALHELREERLLVQIIQRDPESCPALRARLTESVERGYREMADAIRQQADREDLDAEAIAVAALGALVNYDRAQTTYGIAPCDIDEDRLVQAWVSMVTNTLTAAPSTPKRRP
ncbi:MAG: TetR/AcrR family transcriptional regulator [Acidimicrobiales bacterium]